MTTTNYTRGRGKEYRTIAKLRKQYPDAIIQRSAGSRSKVDIWAIDPLTRTVILIQCKGGKSAKREIKKAFLGLRELQGGDYFVKVEVV